MSSIPRLNIAIKALRELGFTRLAQYGLYRLGLRTGWYRLWRSAVEPVTSLRPLFSLPDAEEVRELLGADGLKALLAEADEITSGRVRLFGAQPVPLQLAGAWPPVHWTEFETGKASLSGLGLPHDDIKYLWEPARFGWAFILGRAFHLTGEERYARAFWRGFESFSQGNPANTGPNWMSAQEVALRLMALVWAGRAFAPSAESNPSRQARLAGSVAQHAVRILPTLAYARSQDNNHLLSEAAGLFTAALALPDHPQSRRWRRLGWKWLNWCLQNQVAADGEYIQHSSNYHRLLLHIALWVTALLPAAGDRWPERSLGQLRRASAWLVALTDPASGGVPNFGPNDGALFLPLAVAAIDDYRPVAHAAAYAFGLETPVEDTNELAVWMGLDQGEYTGAGMVQVNDPLLRVQSPTGQSWAFLRAARFNSRPGHADLGHLDLWWRGLNVALDAGTYLYNAEAPWDNPLTHAAVHNTVTVGGTDQFTRAGKFLYLDWRAVRVERSMGPGAASVAHNASMSASLASHVRRVSASAADTWTVTDELLLERSALIPVTIRLHWLLPDWEWRLAERDGRVELSLKSPFGWVQLALRAGSEISEVLAGLSIVRAGESLHGAGPVEPVRGWVSPTYGMKHPALSVALDVQSGREAILTTEFIFPAAMN